jgi:hypothetical protein
MIQLSPAACEKFFTLFTFLVFIRSYRSGPLQLRCGAHAALKKFLCECRTGLSAPIPRPPLTHGDTTERNKTVRRPRKACISAGGLRDFRYYPLRGTYAPFRAAAAKSLSAVSGRSRLSSSLPLTHAPPLTAHRTSPSPTPRHRQGGTRAPPFTALPYAATISRSTRHFS